MKRILGVIGLGLFLASFSAWSQPVQQGQVVAPYVDVYSDPSFDSEVIEQMTNGDVYLISPKPVGPFYRVRTKNGKKGFIPDTEIYIQGKGPLVPGADEVENDPFLGSMKDGPEKNSKNKSKKSEKLENFEEPDEEEELDEDNLEYQGLTLSLFNFNEDTLGGTQVDDLPAIGYRFLGDITWGGSFSFKTPRYYEEKIAANTKALTAWFDFGISNGFPLKPRLKFRYGGGLFARYSNYKVDAPGKSYDLQELVVGPYLEGAVQFKIIRTPLDFSVRFWFDRKSYGSFSIGVYF